MGESELDKIREIIASEFSKRDSDLRSKHNEIEKIKKALEQKIKTQNDLNNKLQLKSSENEQTIKNLKDQINALLQDQINLVNDDDIAANKKQIVVTENELEDVKQTQDEILKEIHDAIETKETLESENKACNKDETKIIFDAWRVSIKKKKITKRRSKHAYKKFDIRRANLIMEAEIEFEVIRERKSLLDRDELFRNVKIKMMKQFKEQMMRLRIQLANKRKYVKINNSFFGEHCFSFSCSL